MLAYMLLSIFGGIVLVFIIFDPKAIPGLWHARIIAILLNHLVWKRSQPSLSSDGPSALFRPLRTRSYCSITEVDFNLHKSNSTFYADLDISRIELLLSLFKDVITPLSPPAREGGTAESAEKDGRRKLKHLTPALGGVSCIFRREIKPWQRYDLVSRVLCWDDKWLYIVSHFLKPSDHNGASLAASEDQIFASAISEYVFKGGRRTVKPREILRYLRFLGDFADADADTDAARIGLGADVIEEDDQRTRCKGAKVEMERPHGWVR
ncbi:hypothetical protein ETB97_007158 [Aspergillus alliaceus]|uniref:Capsule polysaccharide biosynthesis protein n=1 Tax=Petromyces alliaceus TaxID=209559 RepID=A0A8H6EBB6_PETAA|nr:hypothetical protein ETB97_007158 [Aspergillus burnettii]